MNHRLLDYIKSEREKETSFEDIRKSLLAHNWKDSDVDEAIENVSKPKSEEQHEQNDHKVDAIPHPKPEHVPIPSAKSINNNYVASRAAMAIFRLLAIIQLIIGVMIAIETLPLIRNFSIFGPLDIAINIVPAVLVAAGFIVSAFGLIMMKKWAFYVLVAASAIELISFIYSLVKVPGQFIAGSIIIIIQLAFVYYFYYYLRSHDSKS